MLTILLSSIKKNLSLIVALIVAIGSFVGVYQLLQNNSGDTARAAGDNTAQAITISQTSNVSTATSGDTVNFTINYTNPSSIETAEDATIFVWTTSGFQVDGTTCSPTCNLVDSRELQWDLGDLAPSATGSVTYSAEISITNLYKYYHSFVMGTNTNAPANTDVTTISVPTGGSNQRFLANSYFNTQRVVNGQSHDVYSFYANQNDATLTDPESEVSFGGTLFDFDAGSCSGACTFDGGSNTLTLEYGTLNAGQAGVVSYSVTPTTTTSTKDTLTQSNTASGASTTAGSDTVFVYKDSQVEAVDVTQTASGTTGTSGDTVEFTIDYVNNQAYTLDNARLTGILSYDFTYVNNSCFPGCNEVTTREVEWYLGDLAPGESGQVRYSGEIESGSNYEYFYSFAIGTNDGASANWDVDSYNISDHGFALTHGANIYFNNREFFNNEMGELLYVYFNPTYATISNPYTEIDFSVDNDIEWVQGGCEGECVYDADTQVLTMAYTGSAPIGHAGIRKIDVLPDQSTLGQTVSLTSSNYFAGNIFAGSGGDSKFSRGNSFVDSELSTIPSQSFGSAGDVIPVTLSVSNPGNGNLAAYDLTATLDSELDYVASSCSGTCTYDTPSRTITWEDVNLGADDTQNFTFEAQIISNPTKSEVVIESTFSFSDNELSIDVTPYNGSVNFDPIGIVAPGNSTNLVLNWENTGSVPLNNVVISSVLDNDITINTGNCESCNYDAPSRTVSWNLGTIASGLSGTRTFEVIVAGGSTQGTIDFVPVMEATEFGSISGSSETMGLTDAEFVLTADTDKTIVRDNEQVTITYDYTLNGTTNVNNVRLKSAFGNSLTYDSHTCSGCTFSINNTLNEAYFDFATMTSGTSGTITVTYTSSNNQTQWNGNGEITSDETIPVEARRRVFLGRNQTLQSIQFYRPFTVSQVGSNNIFEVHYRNASTSSTENNVQVIQTLQDDMTFVSCTGSCVHNSTNNTLEWSVGTLNPGVGGSFEYIVTISGATDNNFIHGLTHTYSDTFINNYTYTVNNNSASAGERVSIQKLGARDLQSGGQYLYYLLASNTGDATVNSVSVTDVLGSDLNYVSCTGGSSCSYASGTQTVTWDLGSLSTGQSQILTLAVDVNGAISSSTYTNTATIDAPSVVAANASTTNDVVLTPNATFAINGPATANPNDTITYSADFENSGGVNLTSTVMEVTLSSDLVFDSCTNSCTHSGGVITWNIGSLAPGASGSYDFVVDVDAAPSSNVLTMQGTFVTNELATINASASLNVSGLSISQSTPQTVVSGNTTIPITINYANNGANTISNAAIVVTKTFNLNYNSQTCEIRGCDEINGDLYWRLGDLAPGQVGTLKYDATLGSQTPYKYSLATASLFSDEDLIGTDLLRIENSSAANNFTAGSMDGFIYPRYAFNGGFNTHVLPYISAGALDQSNNTLVSNIGPEQTLVPGSCSINCITSTDSGDNIVTFDLGDLLSGDHSVVTFKTQVDGSASGQFIETSNEFNRDTNVLNNSEGYNLFRYNSIYLDMYVTLTADNTNYSYSDTVTYSVTYGNNGTVGASGSQNGNDSNVTVVLSPDYDYVPLSCSNSCTFDGGTNTLTWLTGSISAGEETTYTYQVTPKSGFSGDKIGQEATFFIPNVTFSSDLEVQFTDADVDITHSVPTQVEAGNSYTHTINYDNTGAQNLTNSVISTVLDPDLTPNTSTCGGCSFDSGSRTVSWNVGTINIGTNGALSLETTVSGSTAKTSFDHFSTFNSDQLSTINSGTDTINVVTFVQTISQLASPDPLVKGGTSTFTYNYTNTGTGDLTGVTISNVVDNDLTPNASTCGGCSFDSGSRTLTWNIGNVSSGSNGSVSIDMELSSGSSQSTISNTATITSNEATSDSTSENYSVSDFNATITATDTAGSGIEPGDQTTLTFDVENTGNATLNNIVVSTTLDGDLNFVSCSNSCNESGGVVTWNISSLAASGQVDRTVTVELDGGTSTGVNSINYSGSVDADELQSAIVSTIESFNVLHYSSTISVANNQPSGIEPGQNVEYTITATNTGNSSLNNVVIENVLDSDLTYVSCSNSCTTSGQTITWNASSLSAGAQLNYTLTATVNSGFTGDTIDNAASVNADEINEVTSSTNTLSILQYEVSFSKDTSTPNVELGQNAQFSLPITNIGNSPLTGVTVTDVLPNGLNFVSCSNSCTNNSGTLTWNLGTLNAGQSITPQFTAEVDSGYGGNTITNQASLVTNETPGVNDTAVINTLNYDASITKTNNQPGGQIPGGNVIYTLEASNDGNSDLSNVVVMDVLDGNLFYQSCSNSCTHNSGTVTWTLPTLSAGTSQSLTLEVQVNPGLSTSTNVITNNANMNADELGSQVGTGNNVLNINHFSGTITKSNNQPGGVTPGNNVEYSIEIENTGNIDLSGTEINDTLSSDLNFVSCSNSCSQNGNTITWNTGNLAEGASQTVTLTAQVDSGFGGNSVENTATLSAPDLASDVDSNQDSLSVLQYSGTIDKTTSTPNVVLGGNAQWNIAITNTGNTPLQNSTVDDTLPNGLNFVSCSDSCTNNSGDISWTIPLLSVGETKNLTLTTQVDNSFGGTSITNSADFVNGNITTESDSESITVSTFAATITKTNDKPSGADTGDNITYTIDYENTGNDTLTGVVITDTLDSNLNFVSCTGGCGENSNEVVWTIGSVNAGATGQLELVAEVDSATQSTTTSIDNTVSINANEINETTSAPTSVTILHYEAEVLLGASPSLLEPGDTTSISIDVDNIANGDLSGVTLTFPLTNGLVFDSCDNGCTNNGSELTWNIGNLSAGSTTTVSADLSIDSNYTLDLISLDAEVDALELGSTISSNVVDLQIQYFTASLDKTTSTPSVTPGDNAVFNFEVRNTGNQDLTNLTLTDTLPSELSFVSCTLSCTHSGGVVTWNISSLTTLVNDVFTPELVTTVDSGFTGSSLSNSAVLSSSQIDNQSDSATVNVSNFAASITKTNLNSGGIEPGETASYTISYENTGNSDLSNVEIVDTLDSNLVFSSCNGSCTHSGGVVTWNIGTVTAGQSGSVSMDVIAALSTPTNVNVIDNTATLDADELAADVDSNTDQLSINHYSAVISKTNNQPNGIQPGGTVTYTITYENTGNTPLTGITIGDTLDSNLVFVSCTDGCSHSGGEVTWNTLPTLNAGQTATVSFDALVDATIDIEVDNVARINASELNAEVVSANNELELIQYRASIDKTTTTPNVITGGQAVYEIEIENLGNRDLTNVVVTDTLSSDTTFVSCSSGCSQSGSTITWNTGTLAIGQTLTYDLLVEVDSNFTGNELINNAQVDATEITPIDDSVTIAISDFAASLEKTHNYPNGANPGDVVTYTIAYENLGNSTLTGLELSDTLDTNMSFESCTGGCTTNAQTIMWNIPDLSSGQSGSVQVQATVDSGFNGMLIPNTVALSGDDLSTVTADEDLTVLQYSADITLTADTSSVELGDTVMYTAEIENTGNANQTSGVVAVVLDNDLSIDTATCGGCTVTSNQVEWDSLSILAGETETLSFEAEVSTNPSDTSLDVSAEYENPEIATIADSLSIPITTPNITATVTPSPTIVSLGGNAMFTITLQNTGAGRAADIVVENGVSEFLNYTPGSCGSCVISGNQLTWSIDTLEAGAQTQLSFAATTDTDINPSINSITQEFDVSSPFTGTTTAQGSVQIARPTVSINKTNSTPLGISAGQTPTYTLGYETNGTLYNAMISDELGSDLVFVSCSDSCTFNSATNTAEWNLGNVNTGTGFVTLEAEVLSGTTSTFVDNEFTLSADGINSVTSAANTLPILQPGLNITISASTNSVLPGGEVTYTISYVNNGTGAVSNAQVSDELDDNVSFVSCSDSCSENNGEVIWNIGNVAANSGGSLSLVVNTSIAGEFTSISNEASIDSTEQGPIVSNTVQTQVLRAAGELTANVNPALIEGGDTALYTLTFENTGTLPLTGVSASMDKLSNQTFETCSGCTDGSPITWSFGNVTAGASVNGNVQLEFDAGSLAGVYDNTITLSSNELNDIEATLSVTVDSDPSATLDVTNTNGELEIGDTDTFTITYTNNGNQPLTDVEVEAEYGLNLEYVDNSCSGSCNHNENDRLLIWDIGVLAPGTTGTQTFDMNVVALQTTNNWFSLDAFAASLDNTITVTLSSNELDGSDVISNSENFAEIIILDPEVSVSTDNPTPEVGETYNYTIEVVGGTNSENEPIVIEYTIDDDLEVISCDGCTVDGNTLRWVIDDLSESQTRDLTVVVRATTAGSINNSLTTNTGVTVNDETPSNSSVTIPTPTTTPRTGGSGTNYIIAIVGVVLVASIVTLIQQNKKK